MRLQVGIPSLFIQRQAVLGVVGCKKTFLYTRSKCLLIYITRLNQCFQLSHLSHNQHPTFMGTLLKKKKEEIVSLPMYAFGRPLINI